MFLLKKIISPFLFPLPLCLALQILGLAFLWLTRRQKTGKTLVTLGTALLLLFGYESFSSHLVRGLENAYPALLVDDEPSREEAALLPAPGGRIVVLGSGHSYDPRIPTTSRLSPSSVVRLIEAIRLHRKLPGSVLIFSGGTIYDSVSEAEEMRRLAVELGVSSADILLEERSRDTEDQSRFIKPMVGQDRFILVTSASHMVRAMALFEKQGLHPIPAPTEHAVKRSAGFSPRILSPGVEGLARATDAFYEYMGLAWAKLRGKI